MRPHSNKLKRKGQSAFDFRLSTRAQLAVLHMPQLRNYLTHERRIFLVELFAQLEGQISQNRFARIARVTSSALSQWRKTYAQGGPDALRNRPFGRKPKSGAPPPCVLMFALKP